MREWGEVVEEGSIVDSVEGAGIVPVGLMVVEGGWRRGCESEWMGEEREGGDGGWLSGRVGIVRGFNSGFRDQEHSSVGSVWSGGEVELAEECAKALRGVGLGGDGRWWWRGVGEPVGILGAVSGQVAEAWDFVGG